jgi:hypothetical protein
MRNLVLIEVMGGVAEVTYTVGAVETYVFDWDNFDEAAEHERAEMLNELPDNVRDYINKQRRDENIQE